MYSVFFYFLSLTPLLNESDFNFTKLKHRIDLFEILLRDLYSLIDISFGFNLVNTFLYMIKIFCFSELSNLYERIFISFYIVVLCIIPDIPHMQVGFPCNIEFSKIQILN